MTRRVLSLSEVEPGMVVTVERDGGDRYVRTVNGYNGEPGIDVHGQWRSIRGMVEVAGYTLSVEVEDQEPTDLAKAIRVIIDAMSERDDVVNCSVNALDGLIALGWTPPAPVVEVEDQGDDPIPRYAQLDVWMALYGPEFSEAYDPFREEHGFAEAWAQLLSQVRSAVAVREHAAPVVEVENQEAECICGWTDPKFWTTHYGAVEPGSQREWNPDCPVHPPRAIPVVEVEETPEPTAVTTEFVRRHYSRGPTAYTPDGQIVRMPTPADVVYCERQFDDWLDGVRRSEAQKIAYWLRSDPEDNGFAAEAIAAEVVRVFVKGGRP